MPRTPPDGTSGAGARGRFDERDVLILLAGLLSAVVVASALRLAWNPGWRSYLEYVPVGGLLGAFVWERVVLAKSANRRQTSCDVLVVVLALMRVFVPPLPFVSGHTLFASYAAATARTWALRSLALIVLAEVVYVKVFVSPGLYSMLGGLAAAAVLAKVRAGLSGRTSHPEAA